METIGSASVEVVTVERQLLDRQVLELRLLDRQVLELRLLSDD